MFFSGGKLIRLSLASTQTRNFNCLLNLTQLRIIRLLIGLANRIRRDYDMSFPQNLADTVIQPTCTFDYRPNSAFRKPFVSKRRSNTAEEKVVGAEPTPTVIQGSSTGDNQLLRDVELPGPSCVAVRPNSNLHAPVVPTPSQENQDIPLPGVVNQTHSQIVSHETVSIPDNVTRFALISFQPLTAREEVGLPAVLIRTFDEVTVQGDADGAGAVPNGLPALNKPPNHLGSRQEVAERAPDRAADGNAEVPTEPTGQQALYPERKMWMCSFERCGKVFRKPNLLARHKEIHNQFKCEICNKTYRKTSYYKKHVIQCSKMYRQ